MNTIEQQQTLGRIHRQPSCEIVFFTIASGGIGEDISKRKPIKIIGNPRNTFYSLAHLNQGVTEAYNKMCAIAYPAFEKYGMAHDWPQSKRRAYQRWVNRRRALNHAIYLKSL